MVLIPPRLRAGDTIGVVSPSLTVASDQMLEFEAGIACLMELGLSVTVGDHVFSTNGSSGVTPQEKAHDINRMFADGAVKAIICSQGGDTANTCLPYLDWGCIQQNPKIFTGISDITVLLNAIYHQTGLVTFHGNDVIWGFGHGPQEYNRREFVNRFMSGEIGAVPACGSRLVVRPGKAEGRLLGGNIRCLLKLAGTPYFPDLTGAILFLEALHATPESSEAAFYQLKQMGVFEKVGGVIVGFIYSMQKGGNPHSQVEEVLARVTEDYKFPILKVNDFGHNHPNTVLPVGAEVRLDTEVLSVEILEPCVG